MVDEQLALLALICYDQSCSPISNYYKLDEFICRNSWNFDYFLGYSKQGKHKEEL